MVFKGPEDSKFLFKFLTYAQTFYKDIVNHNVREIQLVAFHLFPKFYCHLVRQHSFECH